MKGIKIYLYLLYVPNGTRDRIYESVVNASANLNILLKIIEDRYFNLPRPLLPPISIHAISYSEPHFWFILFIES